MTARPEADPAAALSAAFAARRPLAPFSDTAPLTLPDAYAAAARLAAQRGPSVGRKIGFTNRALWPRYGVDGPIWGHVHASTLADPDAPVPLVGLMEPRIEPEIVLGLAAAPASSDPADLAAALDWVAPGFEIVQSPYPGWRFDTADAVAAGALHGRLIVGPRVPAGSVAPELLPELGLSLLRNGEPMESGRGANALGGPLAALGHLVETLAADPAAPPLAAGEMVSTGTLTDAFPVAGQETWTAAFDPPLGALTVTFA
jgi:2-oxo-3-hexenedioate decarboxylase